MKLKIKKIFCLLCLCFLAFPVIQAQDITDFYFEDAQPRKEDVLAHFPRNYRGLYKSDKDSTRRLRVTADSVIFEIPLVQFAPVKELPNKNYSLQDTVLVRSNGKNLPCFIQNDTVYFVDFVQSVYFVRNQKNVIKKLDETIVMSKQVAENKWECALLYPENGKICLAYFDPDKKTDEIRSNKKIDEVKEGGISYFSANLKKKDFLKLMDKNYFPGKQYFYKRFDWQ